MKEELINLITTRLCISKDDLTKTELEIIDITLGLVKEKIEDLHLAEETIKRLTIENKNLKSYQDNKDYYHPEDYFDSSDQLN